jgi:hypothetical protein
MENPVLHIRGWQAEFTALRRDLHIIPEPARGASNCEDRRRAPGALGI